MRASGDHVCWVYEDEAEFVDAAVPYLAAGLELGQRITFTSGMSRDDACEALRPLGDVGALLDRGALEVACSAEVYGAGGPVDGPGQVRAYARATGEALGAGFSGLRTAADVTPLVAGPEQRRAFAAYEHLADRYMAAHPFTAMCGYDRRRVGDAVGEIACLHQVTNAGVPFHCSAGDRDGHLRLTGEVDVLSCDLLVRALRHVGPGPWRVDGRELRFIDHRALLELARAGVTDLESGFAGAARLAALVGAELRVTTAG